MCSTHVFNTWQLLARPKADRTDHSDNRMSVVVIFRLVVVALLLHGNAEGSSEAEVSKFEFPLAIDEQVLRLQIPRTYA